MSRQCIICGRSLKTGRKYCYSCRSLQHARDSRPKFAGILEILKRKWFVTWLLFWIIFGIILLKFFPEFYISKTGDIFVWITGIITILISIIYFKIIKQNNSN